MENHGFHAKKLRNPGSEAPEKAKGPTLLPDLMSSSISAWRSKLITPYYGSLTLYKR